jgi:malonate transporter and related proteins
VIAVLSTTGVVFVLIALGYVSTLRGIFGQEDQRVFGRYIVSFALPALVFSAISKPDIGEILDPVYVGAYLVASLIMFAVGHEVSLRVFRLSPAESTFQGMGMSCSNSGFVGYPILLMTLPPLAPTVLALNMTVENLVMIPLILIFAERASGGEIHGWKLFRRIFGRLARNPIVIGILLGLIVSFFGIPLPRIVTQPIELIAASSAAVSLLMIGGTLVGLPLRAIDAKVILVVLGKLAIFPIVVGLVLSLLETANLVPASADFARAAILSAAMPPAGIYPILAQRYEVQERAALAMLLTTSLSFFTISAVMLILGVVV